MSDYIELALTYGGFTSLDRHYLKNILSELSDQEKLSFITPPPSVINAYFAEIYQKQFPKAATDYYLELTSALRLEQKSPSFKEDKPFVRLNLSGRAYGFAYENSQEEIAIVFSELPSFPSQELLFEIAQIFPHYLVYLESEVIKMKPNVFKDIEQTDKYQDLGQLTKEYQLNDRLRLLSGYNSQEILELSQKISGRFYYGCEQREFKLYIEN
ncbi:cystathionine beta-lyase [Streptococcus catagoni]|uniref:cystathionine beta-lyase n=1 Tax=Streptococcus catagoni TaxID=2654874 RepID=UPI00140E8127|nr:cystathionine beta-lyase [Streptococcus catagoni]